MLRDLAVLVLDCQASGATPVHGDLLELGWGVCAATGLTAPPRAHWIVPRTDRDVPRVVRKLTGWSDDCAKVAVDPAHAWALLHSDAPATDGNGRIPTVIHFARFELPFLRELHLHAGGDESCFPFDTICLHAIAQRLFPDLPRRNLRALAGHLGHSPELVRRSAGHVEASAFIWRAVVPLLGDAGVHTWDELKTWLDGPSPTSSRSGARSRRTFPLSIERRRSLPDAPGVYRFLRPNGDVLYVGKAVSLKKRVASHFTSASRATNERVLEMLSQAHDVAISPTETALEAALLETDEIKRIDPPYNVQLRTGDRRAWFASTDWRSALPFPDAEHSVGPLPSERALSALAAVRALLEGTESSDALRCSALGVPPRWAPDAGMFDEAWNAFVREELSGPASARARILAAARRIVVDDGEDEAAPDAWDLPRVRRNLERVVVQEGGLVHRARALCLLSESIVTFREPNVAAPRILVVKDGDIIERGDVLEGAVPGDTKRPSSRRARQAVFDAARYDRLRVLATELRRIADQGGAVTVHVGEHRWSGAHRSPPSR